MESSDNLHFKKKNGKCYKIVGAESTGWRREDVDYFVKSLETGKIKRLTRKELLEMRTK